MKNIFNWLFGKKQEKEDTRIEYTFIWYKKMKTGNKTFYTQPFRTKVKAKNFKEAKEKLTSCILGKMKLIIVSEDEYNKTDLSKFEKGFDDLYKQMDGLFGKVKNSWKTKENEKADK